VGLAGDSVDLDHRLDQFRRDRSPRASSARSMAQRWASQVAADASPSAAEAGRQLRHPASCALAFRIASRAIAQWQLRARQWPGRRGGADFVAGARALYRGRRTDRHGRAGRILLAAPIAQDEIERAFADQIETATRSRSIAARWRLRARARALHAVTLSEAPMALSPSAERREFLPMA
jgi:ATP-dependent helicase HrpB